MELRARMVTIWRLFRPFTLTASMIPVLVGTSLAALQRDFHIGTFLAMFFASVLIQGATNMFNEYFDYRRGLDSERMVGIAGAIVRDGMRPKTVLSLGVLCIAMAVALGVFICMASSWWVAVVGSLCILVAYLYSGGPIPLSYTPLGELSAAICMGPTIVLLAYFVQAHNVDPRAALISTPIGLLIGLILFANNLRDIDEDRLGGRRTLAILLGRRAASAIFAGLFCIVYISIAVFVCLRLITPWALISWITLPSAISVIRMYYSYTEPQKLHGAVKGTSNILFRFGLLMFIGMMISLI